MSDPVYNMRSVRSVGVGLRSGVTRVRGSVLTVEPSGRRKRRPSAALSTVITLISARA